MPLSKALDHASLQRLVEAGAVRSVSALGQPGGWVVLIRYGMCEAPLAAQRSRKVRLFRSIDTLAKYLRELGLAKFDVDASGYEAESIQRRRRPDRAAALRELHRVARAQTQATVHGVDHA